MVTERKRKLHIDMLRLLAAFLVVYHHTDGQPYFLVYTNESYKMIFTMFLSAFSRNSVPLFFMISGALLLGREETYRQLFSRRILRYVAVLTFASLVYYCLAPREGRSPSRFVYELVNGTIAIPYWFLYAYLSMLLILPFLRKIAKNLNGQDILMLIAMRFLFWTFMDVREYVASYLKTGFLPISNYLAMHFSTIDILFYPLIGYYLENRIPAERITGKRIVAMVGVSLFCMAIAVGFTWHEGVYRGGFTENWAGMFTYVTAPLLYVIIRWLYSRIPQKWLTEPVEDAVYTAGSLTLGIYILDPVLSAYARPWIRSVVGASFLLVPVSVLYSLFSMLLCGCITWGLKKMPVLKKIL